MQYPQWMYGQQQAYDEDLPTSCLNMFMNAFVAILAAVFAIAIVLMGVDWLFDTSFASDFITWVSGLIEGIGD